MHVARALLNKGICLADLSRVEEALAIRDEVVRRFGDAPEPALRALVARALINTSVRLSASKRGEEALAVYDEVVRRFGDAPEPALRAQVARALLNKSALLNSMDRIDEAMAVCGEVVRRFGDSKEAKLNTPVAQSLNFIGFNQLVQAKRHWKDDDNSARSLLREAEATISSALARTPESPIALGNAGYIAFLLGREADARALLAKAIQLGGEKLRQAELKDADIHPLPQDEAFRALVLSLPGPADDATKPAAPSLDAPDPGAEQAS
ncbi:tetratricopeptide repeat protein [Sorangium sp. So ce296]|uniref:tetratricopeptide repeat protein n=1 Tax=Sorangium sp. So ce296 TaxID=3133296 RepID=UPI003F60317D